MNIARFEKMSTEELKAKVKKYDKKITIVRVISALVYAGMTIFMFSYLLYKFEFTTLSLFILLVYLMIFFATLSGFESALGELHNIKDEIEITIYNRKEDDKWRKMQRR